MVATRQIVATTWTPTLITDGALGTPTYNVQSGTYEIIGRQVTVRFRVRITNWTGQTGNVFIGGLPVPSANTAQNFGVCDIAQYTASLTAGAGLGGVIPANSSAITLLSASNVGTVNLPSATAGTNLDFIGKASYNI